MVSPAPVTRPRRQHLPTHGLVAAVPRGARSTTRFLRSFGFHVLAALLGIALIFM